MEESINRELQSISAPDKIRSILSNHLKGRILYIKGTDPVQELRIVGEASPDKNEVYIKSPQNTDFETGPVSLYQILGRYIELQCRIMRKDPKTGLSVMSVDKAFIAKKQREGFRMQVRGDEVYITNIRTSKNTIEASAVSIPTSVKVNFGLFEQTLKKRADFAKVDVYSHRDPLFDEIRKNGKIYYISDTQTASSYSPEGDEYIDAAKLFGLNISKKIQDYRRLGIKSEIIFPIRYISHDNSDIPLGYIHLQSKVRNFDDLTVQDIKNNAESLINKIKDSNTVYIQEKQRVTNISRGGLRVLIDNAQLKDYLVKQKGFTFDLVFKMQAPITIYGIIRTANKNPNGQLSLGIQISGNSSRTGEMKRYDQNIAILENQAKEALLAKQKAMAKLNQNQKPVK
jgi:hypothetical protein